jgi:hypothetical protein
MTNSTKKFFLSLFILLSREHNFSKSPSNVISESPTLLKFAAYEKEINTLIDSVIKEINLNPLYDAISSDFDALYSKLELILGKLNETREQNNEEKIANYKFSIVFLYQVLPNLNLFSEESLRTIMKSFLFTVVRMADSDDVKNNFFNDTQILAVMTIIKAMGIELESIEVAQKLLQKIESKLEKLKSNKPDDYKYEYAYYKIIEKTVDQFFSTQKNLLVRLCDKWVARTHKTLKYDLENGFKNKKK